MAAHAAADTVNAAQPHGDAMPEAKSHRTDELGLGLHAQAFEGTSKARACDTCRLDFQAVWAEGTEREQEIWTIFLTTGGLDFGKGDKIRPKSHPCHL